MATPHDRQPRHPIRVAASRTGLSLDVLRVWERRYAAVHPGRGEGGHRLYSDADIERLGLLRRATEAGRSISHVAPLPDEELKRLVEQDEAASLDRREAVAGTGVRVQGEAASGLYLEAALAAADRLDPAGLDAVLRQATLALGTGSLISGVLAPFLERVGDGWRRGDLTPAHEHAASAVVHGVLDWIGTASEPGRNAPGIVIATPASERHELGAMLAAALARASGWRVTYLGPDLPVEAIAGAARQTGAACVALSLIYPPAAEKFLGELTVLRAELGDGIPLIVGGAAAVGRERALAERGARVVADLNGFMEALSELAVLPPRGR